ncbi:MAG: helix-turn-helix domain-containing protein [Planctomycetota bacterium]|nr:helix-turn-helix domain-containing protein [Planctomycetota bacterium]
MDEILERLERIESALACLVKQRLVQDWYDTTAAAELLGKSPYTVREYCRQGRIHAQKRVCGRGKSEEWMISHEELMRVKAEGLLPDPLSYRHPRPR